MLGIAGKNNTERTKLRAKNALFSITASGIAITVIRTVVPTVNSSVKPRPASMDGSVQDHAGSSSARRTLTSAE